MNALPHPTLRPDWPRLMNERDAAAYLSIGTTTLREKGPEARKIGSRTLWDRRDLDRWADALDGQPLSDEAADAESRETERRFFERREGRGNE